MFTSPLITSCIRIPWLRATQTADEEATEEHRAANPFQEEAEEADAEEAGEQVEAEAEAEVAHLWMITISPCRCGQMVCPRLGAITLASVS